MADQVIESDDFTRRPSSVAWGWLPADADSTGRKLGSGSGGPKIRKKDEPAWLTSLLDTSAWLTHAFNEPGRQRINALFDSNGYSIGVCVLSLVELPTRLKALNRDGEFERLWTLYRPLLDRVISVEVDLADRVAEALRQPVDAIATDAFSHPTFMATLSPMNGGEGIERLRAAEPAVQVDLPSSSSSRITIRAPHLGQRGISSMGM